MKHIQFKTLILGVITLFLSANSWAGRLLIQDENQTVMLNHTLDCYHPADVIIDTTVPEFFEPGSRQLQNISDTVRAILSYECPGLSEINITGLIRGLSETIYRGQLSARDDWRVQTALEKQAKFAPTATITPVISAPARHSDAMLTLTGLTLSMPLTEAKRALGKAFDSAPRYDAQSGIMRLQIGGCPIDFEPGRDTRAAIPGWKCLTAWFSDQRIPVLERIELTQVLESSTLIVKKVLLEKYGLPVVVSTSSQNTQQNLQWLSINGTQILDATLSDIDSSRVLTHLTLSGQAEEQTTSTASTDIGLKL